MHETVPKVYMIACPIILPGELEAFLTDLGEVEDADGNKHSAMEWMRRIQSEGANAITRDAEILVEFMARGCYRSFAPGLNANVTKVREDSAEYIANVLRSAHGSVLEHAQFSFMFKDVSRVFTHELVRHRAGVAISQESLRYVRLTDLGFRIPDVLQPMAPRILSIVETLEEFQRDAAEEFGLDETGTPFAYKKEVTSALRRLAPIGLSTNIGWSANVRTLRFVIQKRTEAAAEEEIRYVFGEVCKMMMEACPMLFGDFKPNEKGEWVPAYEKV